MESWANPVSGVSVRDSYQIFFEQCVSKERLFRFGLDETILCTDASVGPAWRDLKHRAFNNGEVYIRGFGRNSSGSHLFQQLYSYALSNENVKIDPTNNKVPTEVLREYTGFSKVRNKKYSQLRNYQVSHVFGRTKNIFAFSAPWNIVYIPKILDPFTGHEAKGEAVKEFTKLFQRMVYDRFKEEIEDFNAIMTDQSFINKIGGALTKMKNSGKYDNTQIINIYKGVQSDLVQIKIKT